VAKLKTYRAKRDFGKTSEPRGAASRKQGRRYVIQKHAATRLHYDLRLELGGVMLSWAVTRGPSLVPGDKRLAVHVEDHPVEYNTFEGTIPKGQYGGGTVMIWDRGTWTPEFDPELGMKKGHLEFTLHGKKLKGRWHLVRMHKRPGERQEPWLLIKGEDEFARGKSDPDILEEMPDSVASRRSMEQIAEGRSRVWHSNKPASEQSARRVAPKQKSKTKPRESRAKARISGAKADKTEKSSGSLRKPSRVSGARRAALPTFVSPSLATLAAKAPSSADFVHEIKFDGYRMQAWIGGGKVELRTRTGLDWTDRFPTVAEALKALKRWDAIIDGEIVSGDANGVSDFSALQDDLKSGRRDRLVYYAFDLMHLDGYDLTGATLIERKALLEALLAMLPKDGIVRLSEHFETEGSKMLQLARDMKLEGIVSKRRESHYRAGRVGDWLKIKCANSQELVVAGYAPSDVSPKRMAALVLGYYDKLGFTYAGRVGTGFTDKMRDDFWKRLQPLRVDHCPFGSVPEEERTRAVHWVKPQMVIEVDFRGWTGSGYVRQASFKGVREDKPAKQVTREIEQPLDAPKLAAARQPAARKTSPAKGKKKPVVIAGVTLTHPERVYWDDAGVTKQMLAEYYETVWDRMRPHVAGRVLSLVRAPDGIGGQTFYQKHASAGMDRGRLHLVKEPDGEESISVDDLGGLVSLAQAGVLEVHVRGSTIEHLEEANRLVFDLDPGPGVDWKDVIAGAREVRERLNDLKLTSFVKTTGGKGLHVVVPVRPAPWDEVKAFCRELAESMAADNRARYTATIKKSARDKRIFIDYLRNSREATAIAPYSTRARPGATVSVPLSWQKLGTQKAPNLFTVLNLSKRLARQRKDPWADMARVKQTLPTLRRR
jgi:bifunctional non-homologous end joining protein LigD